jgi:hypothetical protein
MNIDTLLVFAVLAFAFQVRRAWEQRQRIALLGRYLRNFQIEGLMETLTQGYLRAMGEADPERRRSVWNILAQHEQTLARQLEQLVQEVGKADSADWRASTLLVNLPLAVHWLPGASFDMRTLLRIHAQGITEGIANGEGLSGRDRAFRLSAELLLLQHSCHWFCRSKTVASARMLARHHTRYAQLLAAVAPATRLAYQRVMGERQGT